MISLGPHICELNGDLKSLRSEATGDGDLEDGKREVEESKREEES
jgi:hypothetical protein